MLIMSFKCNVSWVILTGIGLSLLPIEVQQNDHIFTQLLQVTYVTFCCCRVLLVLFCLHVLCCCFSEGVISFQCDFDLCLASLSLMCRAKTSTILEKKKKQKQKKKT